MDIRNIILIFVSQTIKHKTMVILFYLVCLGIGLGMGYLIAQSNKPKCNHKWKLIEKGEVWRGNINNTRGWVKVYQCEHCLKMRKEQIEID